jgi:hypothetical protein
MEDSVIEHDARHIQGYELVHSDLTGRALFERGEDQLEVFTANRRPLEHCFGVDLIYLNANQQKHSHAAVQNAGALTDRPGFRLGLSSR